MTRPAFRALPIAALPVAVLPIAAILFLAVASMANAQTSLPPSGFEIGQRFPTLTFPALEDGAPRSIVDFRGHRVILHIFASW